MRRTGSVDRERKLLGEMIGQASARPTRRLRDCSRRPRGRRCRRWPIRMERSAGRRLCAVRRRLRRRGIRCRDRCRAALRSRCGSFPGCRRSGRPRPPPLTRRRRNPLRPARARPRRCPARHRWRARAGVLFELPLDVGDRSRFESCSSLMACISCGVITSAWLWRISSRCDSAMLPTDYGPVLAYMFLTRLYTALRYSRNAFANMRNSNFFAHVLVGKPVPTFPDMR